MNMVHRELLTQLPLRRDLEFGVVIKGQIVGGSRDAERRDEESDAADPHEESLPSSFQAGLGVKVKNPADSPGILRLQELTSTLLLPCPAR